MLNLKNKNKNKEARKRKKQLKRGRLTKKKGLTGLLFVSPWIIGVIIFLIYPIITSFWYSLNNIRITPIGKNFNFVGIGNFTQILLSDPDFPTQLIDYIISTLISVPIINVFALMIAMMLNQNIKFKSGFRLIFFLPVIIVSGPVIGMLASDGGVTISSVDTVAIQNAISTFLPRYIASPISEIFTNMIMILWYSGVQILIFLSGLQKIDKSMYEAAKIDGGSQWECFWKITLPNIKSLILLNCIYTIVYISGNEQNEIIMLIQRAMFSGTKEKGYGYASAMAWVYSVVVVLIVLLFAGLIMGRKDKYERQAKKYRRQLKKEERQKRKIERRNRRHAKKFKRAEKKGKFTSYEDLER